MIELVLENSSARNNPAGEPDGHAPVHPGQAGIQGQAGVLQQMQVAAQDGDLPGRALQAQDLSELDIQVAQVVGWAYSQPVGRVGDHPAAADRLDG